MQVGSHHGRGHYLPPTAARLIPRQQVARRSGVLPEHVCSLACAEPPRGDEQAKVELVEFALALDVVGGEGNGGLPQADGMQVAVDDGQAKFLAGLTDALGYRLASRVVATDGDIGVVGAVALPLPRTPSESYLQQEHGVSRVTVRKAVSVLRDEGAVYTIQARGTFVT
jgi:hypothetical protein